MNRVKLTLLFAASLLLALAFTISCSSDGGDGDHGNGHLSSSSGEQVSSSSEIGNSSSSSEGGSSSSAAVPTGDVMYWGHNPYVDEYGWEDMEMDWEWYYNTLSSSSPPRLHYERITGEDKKIVLAGSGNRFFIVPQSLGELTGIIDALNINRIDSLFTKGEISINGTAYYIYMGMTYSVDANLELTLQY